MILKEQGNWLSNKFTEDSEPLEAQRLLSGGIISKTPFALQSNFCDYLLDVTVTSP